MINEIKQPDLGKLFTPQSIAVIGASQQPNKVGGMPIQLLQRMGFKGRIYPVNPRASEVQGLPCYPSVPDIRDPIDMGVVVAPAIAVPALLEALGRAGASSAVVLSSGFAEVDADGARRQEEIAKIARTFGMALLGPNCLGVMSLRSRVFATFSPAPLAGEPALGGVAIVSQSGAFGAYAYLLANRHELGLSHWITTGNEAVLSVADVIDWLADDEETRVILAYIEGAKDGRLLKSALLKARMNGKPVIITKVGRTEAGARAAMSHTASLAGEDAIYDAVFESSGCIRAKSIDEMFRFAQAFSTGVKPGGSRLGIVTSSGGVGALMADAAFDARLDLPELPPAYAKNLRDLVPFCSTKNPIDVTGQITSDPSLLGVALEAACRSEAYDSLAIFVAGALASKVFAPKIFEAVRVFRDEYPNMPMGLSGIADKQTHKGLSELGCLIYEEPTHIIDALGAMSRWTMHTPKMPEASIGLVHGEVAAGSLTEAEGLRLLHQAGVPVAPHRIVHTAEQAINAWRDLGSAKVVMKIVSRDLLHKSDAGGVWIGLGNEQEIREAYAAIEESVQRFAPTARLSGMLVAKQLTPIAEVMLGARYDSVFGTVLVLGRGGVAVELDAQTAVLDTPTDRDRVKGTLDRLGVTALLAGFRGRPKGNVELLIDAIIQFSRLAESIGPRLETLEVNPLIVHVDGVAAADAVVTTFA